MALIYMVKIIIGKNNGRHPQNLPFGSKVRCVKIMINIFLEVALPLWSFTCMPLVRHCFRVPKSGTPHSKVDTDKYNLSQHHHVGIDWSTYTSCGHFSPSVPVDDSGEVAGGRDLPPNNHFYRKRNDLSPFFTKSTYFLWITFGATTKDVLSCINVICSRKSQTFSPTIDVRQPQSQPASSPTPASVSKTVSHDHHILNACDAHDLQDIAKISNRTHWWFPNELTCA